MVAVLVVLHTVPKSLSLRANSAFGKKKKKRAEYPIRERNLLLQIPTKILQVGQALM